MDATFSGLMTEGLVSCRAIMAQCPEAVERTLQVQAFAAAQEAAADAAAPAHWFRVRDRGEDSFLCWRDDHTGAFESSAENVRQAGVDPATLPVLELAPSRRVVPDSVIAFQNRLGDALGHGSGLSADEREKLAALHQCLGSVRNACEDGYTDRMTTDGLQTLLPAFSPGENPISAAQKQEALAQLKQSVLRMRKFFAADVFLTVRLSLFPTLLSAVADAMGAAGADETGIGLQLTRFFFTPYSEAVTQPARLIPNLVEKMSREGYGGLVEAEAKTRLAAGIAAIESALDAGDLDDYGASLYAATHECFAASHLYECLDLDAKRHPDRPGGKWWAQSSKVAEEKLVRCANALFRLISGPFPTALTRHQARVSEAFQRGGKDARRGVVNDLIENNYFYPRYFAPTLSAAGGVSAPPA